MRLRFPPWILLSDIGPIPESDAPASASPTSALSPGAQTGAGGGLFDASSSPTPAEAAAQQQKAQGAQGVVDPRDLAPELSYLRHLQRNQPPPTIMERFAAGYQDYLQAPLQPLTDNLESMTYEVFEKDPVKYDWYERATAAALQHWLRNGWPGSGPNQEIVIAVVGAGRGPLVKRALQAGASANARIEVWAVEKNPNAIVLLQQYNRDHWAGQVNVVASDMRAWPGPRRTTGHDGMPQFDSRFAAHSGSGDGSGGVKLDSGSYDVGGGGGIVYGKVDILISELLGSFGDNELSPECLDGVQRVLNPAHGMSIPATYSAHLTPIATPRLHADIRARCDTDASAAENPYVVMLQSHAYLSFNSPIAAADSSPVIHKAWEFAHPARPPFAGALVGANTAEGDDTMASGSSNNNQHNARFAKLKFRCPWRGACDGLAGYFETTLWGDVELSTRPDQMERKSPNMTSWFPLYFPLKVSRCPFPSSSPPPPPPPPSLFSRFIFPPFFFASLSLSLSIP